MSMMVSRSLKPVERMDGNSLECRRTEAGWNEVWKGLNRVFLGYLLLACTAAGFAALIAAKGRLPEWGYSSRKAADYNEMMVLLTVLALAVVGMAGYALITVGEWKCLNAPTRKGAKWLMFGSLTCLLMTPIIAFVSRYGNAFDKFLQIRNSGRVQWLEDLGFSGSEGVLQFMTGVLGAASTVLFVIFLRALACCFRNKTLTWSVDVYLLFLGGLMAGSVYIVLSPNELSLFRPSDVVENAQAGLRGGRVMLAVWMSLGWLVAFVWYLGLVAIATRTIRSGIQFLRSPLRPS